MMATPAKDIKPSADRDDGGGVRDYNSDSSIEEIPESSFKQRIGKGNPKPIPNPNLIGGEGGGTIFSHRTHRSVSTANASNRAWKGGDAALHHSQQYPNINNTNFTSNLYNFAWAQAVQNKPLGFSNQPSAIVPSEHCIVLDDEQREEGELEEGEIGDLDSEELELQGECDSKDQNNDGEEKAENIMVVEEGSPRPIEDNNDGPEIIEVEEDDDSDDGGDNHDDDDDDDDEKMDDFDIRLITIIEELEILPEDVEKSFDDACSQMHKALEKLKKIVLDGPLDVVIQQAFIGVQTIHSVFLKRKEQHRYVFKRLLEYIERQKPKLFSSEQMKEIYSMLQSASPDHITDSIPLIETKQIFSRDSNGESTGLPLSKSCKLESLIIPKNRFEFKPLLDPRANHDEGSLPSPTHETAYPPLIQRSIYSGSNVTASQPTTCRREETSYGSKTAVYETDALRAVCSYQKKYDRISYLSENRLPSPTPSDESNNDKIDSHSEVSSITNNKTISSFGVDNSKNITSGFRPELHHSSYISNSDAKVSSKSRDPRLRIANLNTVNSQDFNKQPATIGCEASKNGFPGDIVMDSRKQNIMNGYSINYQSMKRQKYDCSGYTNPQMASIGKAGYLEKHNINTTLRTDNNHPMEVMGQGKLSNVNSDAYTRQDIHGHIKGENIQRKNIQSMDAVSKVSFPALLKEITTNPTMLIHLLKEQHRLTAEGQQKSANLNQDATNSMAVFSPNIYIKSSESEEKLDAKAQSIFQLTMSEAGKPRMKPRDPRRILHNNMVKKIESLGSESVPSLNANGRDSIIVREQGEKQQISGMPSQTQSIQDITSQFVNNKKNVVDTMSTKQNNPAVAFHPINSQPVSKSANNASSIQRSTEVSMPATSQLPNQWGDVDYLLDGYDDKQKAAIQRERARRIEEQSKMFNARKLCLVLDLDHTLLNSAKFVEVDQFHDEILRTKEEQDRDQPQRHLYRFQHMAMWTKLRPGVWNFLEKASKLFELHLYTMGNNVYATEMAKILDPKGALFAGRVISKGDDGDSPDGDDRLPKSKDLDGVLGMESAVVIIDDSIRVWPHHKLNLIVVERYMYFPSSRRQFGLPGPSLLEIDRDERPEDGSLASSLAVIERIHQNFFSRPSLNNVDVRNILAAEQHKILGGCRIVFSRIFPVGEINPQRHPLWQTAEQFGAICTNQLDDQVTHVVTNSPGTNKVNWALSMGKFVVYPGWVESSALLYRRASEHDFSVSKL